MGEEDTHSLRTVGATSRLRAGAVGGDLVVIPVKIGVYKFPDVGYLDPSAKPVFSETKTLAEVQ
jgi:hypothetical protein